MNPYKWLWSNTTGRPFTYILRDIYHQAEWLVQGVCFFIGIFVGIYFGWKIALIAWGVYTLGYIGGHIHWGKKYTPHQGVK